MTVMLASWALVPWISSLPGPVVIVLPEDMQEDVVEAAVVEPDTRRLVEQARTNFFTPRLSSIAGSSAGDAGRPVAMGRAQPRSRASAVKPGR